MFLVDHGPRAESAAKSDCVEAFDCALISLIDECGLSVVSSYPGKAMAKVVENAMASLLIGP